MTTKLTQIGKLGDGFSVDENGIINVASQYTLPTASTTVLGGVKVGTNLSIDGNGVLSATGGGSGGQYLIQRSLEGVLYETAFLPWIAPAACVVASADIFCESTGALTKVQIMKNGTLESNSIFASDLAIQVASTDTQMTYGGFFGWSALDGGQTTLAKGDKIYFRVNQADVGGADLLVQLRCTIS